MLIALPAPQLVEIVGADALVFAQAQFSSDVFALENGSWQWSAWLSAQGRVRAFFHLLRDSDQSLRLVLRGGSAKSLRDALARYVLRAKVQLQVINGARAYAIEHESDVERFASFPIGTKIEGDSQTTCLALPGQPTHGLLLRAADSAPIDADDSDAARNRNALADIDAGIIMLDQNLEGKLLPDWVGLGDIGATSVRKGCYPGQEIVARLHFKGGSKRRLYRFALASEALPTPGGGFDFNSDDGPVAATALIVNSAWRKAGEASVLAVLPETDAGNTTRFDSAVLQVQRIEAVQPASF